MGFVIKKYSVDYLVDGKYIGSITIDQKDREILGYEGRKREVVTKDINFKNKIIKAGTEVVTELHAICGRYKT